MRLRVLGSPLEVALRVAPRALEAAGRGEEARANRERLGVGRVELERAVDGSGPLVGPSRREQQRGRCRVERGGVGMSGERLPRRLDPLLDAAGHTEREDPLGRDFGVGLEPAVEIA